MIEIYVGTIATALYWVCLAAWRTLPIFAIVLILHLALQRRIPARFACLLWMLVVARLLLPVSVASPVAISAQADRLVTAWFDSETASSGNDSEFEIFTYKNSDGESVTIPILPADVSPEQRQRAEAYAARVHTEMPAASSNSEGSATDSPQDTAALNGEWDRAIEVIAYAVIFSWMAGVLFFSGRGIVSHFRFAWKLRSEPRVDDPSVVDCLLRACDSVGVGRRPCLKQVAMIDSPAIFGFWRPVLCLPANWREQLSVDELDWVFKHELAHIKRRDGLILLFAAIAQSIHWFHPMSWIAVSKLRQLVEQAADDTATRGLSESAVVRYGDVLLRYAELGIRKHRPVVGLLAMASSRDLRNRIEVLRVGTRERVWKTRLCLVPVLVGIACVGLTDASTHEPQGDEPQNNGEFQSPLEAATWPILPQAPFATETSEPEHEIQINVAGALEKARSLQPGIDAEAFVKTYFAAAHRDSATVQDGVLFTRASKTQESLMRAMLACFEQAGLWQVAVECRLIVTDVRLLSPFDWTGSDPRTKVVRGNADARLDDSAAWEQAFASVASDTFERSPREAINQPLKLPVRAARVSERDFEIFMRRCQRDNRSNILFAPKVTVFNGQSASISDVVQRPFVTDVSVVKGARKDSFQPTISVLEEGRTIQLNPRVTDQGDLELRCAYTDARIGEVRLADLPFSAPEAADPRITIQVPTLHSESILVQTRLSEDDVLLIFSPKLQESESDRLMGHVFAIRTTLIPDDALEAFVAQSGGE